MSALDAALTYMETGFTVLPLCTPDHAKCSERHIAMCDKPGKRPLVRWKTLAEHGVSDEHIRRWWTRWPTANVAIATGTPSGVVILDVDGKIGRANLTPFHVPRTPTIKSARGSRYLLVSPPSALSTRTPLLPGVDLQADGAYGVMPPSQHASGMKYKWEIPLSEGIACCPNWLLELVQQKRCVRSPLAGEYPTLLRGVAEPGRNSTAARLAGHLIAKGMSKDETLEWLVLWNYRNQPPLDFEELFTVVDSISRRATSVKGHSGLYGTKFIKSLTHAQVAIYEGIRAIEQRRGYTPFSRLFVSCREIADASGYSLGAVPSALRKLARLGLIHFVPGRRGADSKQASEIRRTPTLVSLCVQSLSEQGVG